MFSDGVFIFGGMIRTSYPGACFRAFWRYKVISFYLAFSRLAYVLVNAGCSLIFWALEFFIDYRSSSGKESVPIHVCGAPSNSYG